ncbi:pectinesterase family protein [Halocatena halophila]|uniref:pectinesterase family protein n=1 Tax=Halocatena halophila TaxID=2814576 RepID=UPI002ED2CDBF
MKLAGTGIVASIAGYFGRTSTERVAAQSSDSSGAGNSPVRGNNLVVARDGSGDYEKIQDAIDAIPPNRSNETRVYIKNGRYKEKLRLPTEKTNVTFIGESAQGTVLTYDDNADTLDENGEEIGTTGSSSFFVNGDDFTARNLTFQNSSEPVAQAVAIRIDSDRAAFENCLFLGNQDTLYTHGHDSRQYYRECFIEGDVDFIFGWATCLFENCHIRCKTDSGYVTAASTEREKEFGYVFKNCRVTGEGSDNSYYLGRPWRPYSQTVFMNTFFGDHIKPVGWKHWNDEQDPETAFYGEFQNYGPGYTPDQRADWTHQLSEAQAEQYTTENILSGWDPEGQLRTERPEKSSPF